MNKAKISFIVIACVLALFGISPILSGTNTIPIAIVKGNSMYPTLQYGDLVVFTRPPKGILPNGTIIVFVQTTTGNRFLDSFIAPIVIHRIVGVIIQSDGTIYYKTKGDNNLYEDPFLVKESNILGVPVFVIPKAGHLILFLTSPQGIIVIIALIVFFFMNAYEVKKKEEELKNKFLSRAASLLLEGKITKETFDRLELIVKYSNVKINWQEIDKLTSNSKFYVTDTLCPICSSPSSLVKLDNENLIFCQYHFLKEMINSKKAKQDSYD